MTGRKNEAIPNDRPPNPGPDAVGKGKGGEFDREAEESARNRGTDKKPDDLKPGAQPDGAASVGGAPAREPGVEQEDEPGRSSPIE